MLSYADSQVLTSAHILHQESISVSSLPSLTSHNACTLIHWFVFLQHVTHVTVFTVSHVTSPIRCLVFFTLFILACYFKFCSFAILIHVYKKWSLLVVRTQNWRAFLVFPRLLLTGSGYVVLTLSGSDVRPARDHVWIPYYHPLIS